MPIDYPAAPKSFSGHASQKKPSHRRRIFPFLLILLSAGCQAMYFLTPDESAEIKAEYGKITDEKVAVIVWADRATLDVDPRARRRVADAVVYEMKKHLEKASFVPTRDVTEFQESGADWESMSHQEIARELKCDYLLRIDLLEYTTRAADTPELRKGRVSGSLHLYEGADSTRTDTVYSSEVTATHPPPGEHAIADMSDYDLLRAAIEQFAQKTAKKFYDHRESLRGPQR